MEQLFVTVREIFEHLVLADMVAVIKRQTISSKAVMIPELFKLLGNNKVTCIRYILAMREHCGPMFDKIKDIYPCSSPQALII
jgi:hypothetical protein